MKKKSIYLDKKADNNAAVQNLRRFLRKHLTEGGVRTDFAQNMSMSQTQLNQYLSGVYIPTRKTIDKWAKHLGISPEEMMTTDFEYIPYPFEELFKPKAQTKRVTKKEWRQSYEDLKNDYIIMAREGEVEYDSKIIALIERHKI